MPSSAVGRRAPQKKAARISKQEAARRIASILEGHMESQGLTEEQKSRIVDEFSDAVTQDLSTRPKRRG